MNDTNGVDPVELNPPPKGPKALPPGVMHSADVQKESFARVLLLGPAKLGKTTCLLETAPKPLVINCDGEGATQYAAAGGADFLEIRVGNTDGVGCVKAWTAARRAAKQLVESGDVKTIIVDTLTMLSESLEKDLRVKKEGYDLWNAMADEMIGGYERLAELGAHIFLVCHMDPFADEVSGILPVIHGKRPRVIIPGKVNDWVLFDFEASRNPQRAFLLGPQKTWTHSGRNIRKSEVVKADACELLRTMGFEP